MHSLQIWLISSKQLDCLDRTKIKPTKITTSPPNYPGFYPASLLFLLQQFYPGALYFKATESASVATTKDLLSI